MREFRIFICDMELSGDEITFSVANSKYISRVLRLETGDCVKVFDGRNEHAVRLTHCDWPHVYGVITASRPHECHQNIRLTLAFCCVRPGPMAEILRHGTELGVTRFVPLLSRRANRRPTEKKQRWETVIASSCAQAGFGRRPEILSPMTLEEFFLMSSEASARIILSTAAQARPLLKVLETLSASPSEGFELLIGPEGGLEPVEENRAVAAGFSAASLGAATLRTETAALVAAGITVAWHQTGNLSSTAEIRPPEGTLFPDAHSDD